MKIVIVGYVNKENPSGPGSVINSLLNGLNDLDQKFEFININERTIRGKFKFLKRIMHLPFERNIIVNVHTWGYKIPLIILIMSYVNKGMTYFLTVHGISSYENQLNNIQMPQRRAKLEKILYEKAPNVIFVSNYEKEIFCNNFNNKGNLYVVPNSLLNYKTALSPKNGFRCIYAGGYSKLKNPMECLKIYQLVLKRYPNAELVMCGPVINIELKNEVAESVKNVGLDGKVSVIEKVSKEKLEELYENSTFILAPSKFDTFNMTVLEAMNNGCIPIISRTCGIKDLLGNNCGIVYDKTDEIVDKLRNMNISAQSQQCFDLSIEYTYLEMTKRYITFFGVENE